MVYPVQNVSVVDSLAGKYVDKVSTPLSFEELKESAINSAMEEKYCLSS